MKYIKLAFVFFFCVASAFAGQDWFYGFDNSKTDSLWVAWQKKLMDSFFRNPSIDWGKQGLYMFIDEDSLIRLFYLDLDRKVYILKFAMVAS